MTGTKFSPSGESSQRDDWFWACCNCGIHSSMSLMTTHCPEIRCSHPRCSNCPMTARDDLKRPLEDKFSTIGDRLKYRLASNRTGSVEKAPHTEDSKWKNKSVLWACCSCGKHSSMSLMTTHCPETSCFHSRCSNCPITAHHDAKKPLEDKFSTLGDRLKYRLASNRTESVEKAPHTEESKWKNKSFLWACCYCGKHSSMSSNIIHCPETSCFHSRCSNCPITAHHDAKKPLEDKFSTLGDRLKYRSASSRTGSAEKAPDIESKGTNKPRAEPRIKTDQTSSTFVAEKVAVLLPRIAPYQTRQSRDSKVEASNNTDEDQASLSSMTKKRNVDPLKSATPLESLEPLRVSLRVVQSLRHVESPRQVVYAPEAAKTGSAQRRLENPNDVEQQLIRSSTWKKKMDVRWQCGCGKRFREFVVEYAPGAAQELASFADSHNVIDVERIAEQNSYSRTSSNSQMPGLNYRKSSSGVNEPIIEKEIREASTCARNDGNNNKEFVLVCRNKHNHAKLYHADVSRALCDYTTYSTLHTLYFGRFSGLWRWMSYKEISSLQFVKFHVYWDTNVSITRDNIGLLPPQPSQDYSYHADTNPPVLLSALQHFIEEPSHAPKSAKHRPRIPKKKKEPLILPKDKDITELIGYGIFIQERLRWSKIFAIEAVNVILWLLFAVGWCVWNRGGIQEGFVIAGTGIMIGTVFLGALQALEQSLL